MIKLISKFERGNYPAIGLKFHNGQAFVTDATLELVKKEPQYGSEFATVEDAQWLTPEQKKALLAPPVPAPAPASTLPLAERVTELEDAVGTLGNMINTLGDRIAELEKKPAPAAPEAPAAPAA